MVHAVLAVVHAVLAVVQAVLAVVQAVLAVVHAVLAVVQAVLAVVQSVCRLALLEQAHQSHLEQSDGCGSLLCRRLPNGLLGRLCRG